MFKFRISRLKNKHWAFANLETEKVEVIDGVTLKSIISLYETYPKLSFQEKFSKVKKLYCTLHEQNSSKINDFIDVDAFQWAGNERVINLLDSMWITYKSIDIEVKDHPELNYKYLIFPNCAQRRIDLEKSNLVFKKRSVFWKEWDTVTKWKNYISPFTAVYHKDWIKKVTWIKRLIDFTGYTLVCDNETKQAIQNAKLTWCRFGEILISE